MNNSSSHLRIIAQIIAAALAALLSFGISLSTSTSSASASASTSSPYKIVIDGGSTGSRLHIFEFIQNPQTSKTYVERRGSTKVNIPLSTFAQQNKLHPTKNDNNNDNDAAYHLLPLFQYASEIIPSQYHSTTHVSLQATAGMRLVPIDDQDALYDTIHTKLMDHDDFVFDSFRRGDIQTLDGVLEGLFGVIAVNYLKGVVDVNLEYNHHGDDDDDSDESDDGDNNGQEDEQDVNMCLNDDINSSSSSTTSTTTTATTTTPFGALDLGGASMQIVFLPSKTQNTNEENTCPSRTNAQVNDKQLPSHEFYSTSYLSYGSDQFRERLWDLWITETQEGSRNKINSRNMIENPCSFKGHEIEWNGYILYGTGNAKQCTNDLNRLIPHHEEVDHDNDQYIVGGIQHPEIRGEFYAMSLFFFVMDCVREYTQDEVLLEAWPNPSLHELSMAVESFCSMHWFDDLVNDNGLDRHRFTNGHRLSERCFESAYIVALLRDGFGFDIHARDITYSFLVDDSEVEWSLGMAISLYAEDGKNVVDTTSSSLPSSTNEDLSSQSCEENSTECQQRDDANGDMNDVLPDQEKDALNQIIQNDSMWSGDSLMI